MELKELQKLCVELGKELKTLGVKCYRIQPDEVEHSFIWLRDATYKDITVDLYLSKADDDDENPNLWFITTDDEEEFEDNIANEFPKWDAKKIAKAIQTLIPLLESEYSEDPEDD